MNRIAIFADIHFGRFARSKDFAVPGQIIQDKSAGDKPMGDGLDDLLSKMQPTHIFLAGDLTSVGKPEEFYYCEKKILAMAEKIGVEIENIICSLGNHDVDWEIARIADDKMEHELNSGGYESMSDEVHACIRKGYQKLASSVALQNLNSIIRTKINNEGPLPCTGICEKEEFVVFILNTGFFCIKEQLYPHGKLSEEQLEWFAEMTLKYKDDPRKKIVLMHHHPFNYPYPTPAADISALEEGAEFVKLAIKGNIDIVVHGHRHHPYVTTIQNDESEKPITFMCAGSLAVNTNHRSNGDIPNMVHFLDVDKNKDYFVLHNFQYTGIEGWKPVQYSKGTLMDSVMRVGKIFSKEDRVAAINTIKDRKDDFAEVEWEDLDESLKFMSYAELNRLFKSTLKETDIIANDFPEKVVVVRRPMK